MKGQRQDSLADQMATVMRLAVEHGCYDAHDWLVARWGSDENPPADYEAAPYVAPSSPYVPRFDRSRCPCNPALGGSGICGCILGGPTITCTVDGPS